MVSVNRMKQSLFAVLVLLTMGSISPAYDVILVRSDLPPDWVIAQTYSHRSGIPIVATLPDVLEPHVKSQLSGYKKSGFERVLIIGGEAAISPGIQKELDSMGFATHRISEADRYGTSARVAIELYPDSEEAVLVSGEDFEDFLTARRAASSMGAPILFSKKSEIPVSVLNAMKAIGVKRVVLIDLYLEDFLEPLGYTVESSSFTGQPERDTRPLYLIFGIFLGIIGFAIISRIKRAKERVSYTLLTRDEERIVKAINEVGGELMQDQLPQKTSFSRPKISRIVSDLEVRGILSKEPDGRTQRLRVKKDFYT